MVSSVACRLRGRCLTCRVRTPPPPRLFIGILGKPPFPHLLHTHPVCKKTVNFIYFPLLYFVACVCWWSRPRRPSGWGASTRTQANSTHNKMWSLNAIVLLVSGWTPPDLNTKLNLHILNYKAAVTTPTIREERHLLLFFPTRTWDEAMQGWWWRPSKLEFANPGLCTSPWQSADITSWNACCSDPELLIGFI